MRQPRRRADLLLVLPAGCGSPSADPAEPSPSAEIFEQAEVDARPVPRTVPMPAYP